MPQESPTRVARVNSTVNESTNGTDSSFHVPICPREIIKSLNKRENRQCHPGGGVVVVDGGGRLTQEYRHVHYL